jgi:hypothetical protein
MENSNYTIAEINNIIRLYDLKNVEEAINLLDDINGVIPEF